jgi:hypothetical protein
MPYRGERNLPDLSDSPDYLAKGGLRKLLDQHGWRVRSTSTAALTPEEQKAYGEWNRLGLANGHLAQIVAAEIKEPRSPRSSGTARRPPSASPRLRRATRTATADRARPRTT